MNIEQNQGSICSHQIEGLNRSRGLSAAQPGLMEIYKQWRRAKSAFKLTSMAVSIEEWTILPESTWALQTPSLEMAHHKFCLSTKWAQRALLCIVCHPDRLVSCQSRRYYSASEQRQTVSTYLPYQWWKARPWLESKLIQLFLRLIVHWVEYVLPDCGTKIAIACLDRIFIEAQNDIYFFRSRGSLKVLCLDGDLFAENHCGLNVQKKVGMYLQLTWPLYTNRRVAPETLRCYRKLSSKENPVIRHMENSEKLDSS